MKQQKEQIRKHILALRSSLTPQEHAEKSRAISQNLLHSKLLFSPQTQRWPIGNSDGSNDQPPIAAATGSANGQQPFTMGNSPTAGNSPVYRPRAILTYMPFGSEVDVTPLMEWGWSQHCHIIVPRVDSQSHALSLHQIFDYDELAAGTWGIREPKKNVPIYEELALIGVMLIPGVAFDRRGGRIGYGGGYYDRLLNHFQVQGLSIPLKISLAFDLQLIDEVPMEEHDFRVDHIITEFTIL